MPYRQLLALMSARLAATAPTADGYADAGEFARRPELIGDSLRRTAAGTPAGSRCAACAGACRRSASISRRWTCARIRQCTMPRWRRCSAMPAWPRAASSARPPARLIARRAGQPTRRRAPRRRWRCSARGRVAPHYGDAALRAVHHQHEPQRRRRAGGAGAGACRRLRGRRRPGAAGRRAAVRDGRRPAGAPRHPALAVRRSGLPRAPARARRPPDGDARLFRQRQGWRHRRLALGAAAGADRVGRAGAGIRRAHRVLPRPRRLGSARRRQDRARGDRRAARLRRWLPAR